MKETVTYADYNYIFVFIYWWKLEPIYETWPGVYKRTDEINDEIHIFIE